MNGSPLAVDEPRALAAQRFGNQEPRRARHGSAPSDGTARTRGRRHARRRDRRARCRRRSRRPDWWSRETPGRRRRSPAARAAPRARYCRSVPRCRRSATPPPRRSRRAIGDERVVDGVDGAAAPTTRSHSARPISRPVASPAWRMRRTLCAASSPSASSPSGVAVEPRAPLDAARARSAAPRRRAPAPPPRRTARRRRASCRRRAAPGCRPGRSPPRCRPARSRCCFRSRRPSSGSARGRPAPAQSRRAARRCRCRR